MNGLKIYLAGKMTGLSYEDMQEWRFEFKDRVNKYVKASGITYRVNVFNPCDYYNPLSNEHKSDREAMEFDIYNLKKSDIVVVNLYNQDSIGTCMEVAIARDNGIPVIGLYEDKDELHPWLEECCTRICNSMEELVDHVFYYYMW